MDGTVSLFEREHGAGLDGTHFHFFLWDHVWKFECR